MVSVAGPLVIPKDFFGAFLYPAHMRYWTLLVLWIVTDVTLFLNTYIVAYFMRVGWLFSSDYPFVQHFNATIAAAPLFIAALFITRTFSMTRNQMLLRNGAYIGFAAMVGVSTFTLAYYFIYKDLFSRLLIVQAFVLSAVLVWIWHMCFQRILREVLRKDPPLFRALIVGVTRESQRLIAELNAARNPIVPVAVLDGRGAKETEIDGVPVKGKLNKLEDVLREDGITHLIQCADLEQSLNLLSACRQHGITYMLLPSVLGIVERDERVESLEGHPVTLVGPKEGRWKWFVR